MKTVLVKLGGSALVNEETLKKICQEISHITSHKIIVVHGGGPFINQELEKSNLKWEFVEGQRVTSAEMMDIIEYALTGIVNKKLVRELNRYGRIAVGMSGVDAGTLICEPFSPFLERVGRVKKVHTHFIKHLAENHVVVISPIGCDEKGITYNVNADWAAIEIAKALKVDKMIYLSDQKGILNKDGDLITAINPEMAEKLMQDGTINGGMLVKTRTILDGLDSIESVQIANSKEPEILSSIFKDIPVGTQFVQ